MFHVSTLPMESFDVGLLLLLASHSHLFICLRQKKRKPTLLLALKKGQVI